MRNTLTDRILHIIKQKQYSVSNNFTVHLHCNKVNACSIAYMASLDFLAVDRAEPILYSFDTDLASWLLCRQKKATAEAEQ